jgi:hypothetical protein
LHETPARDAPAGAQEKESVRLGGPYRGGFIAM